MKRVSFLFLAVAISGFVIIQVLSPSENTNSKTTLKNHESVKNSELSPHKKSDEPLTRPALRLEGIWINDENSRCFINFDNKITHSMRVEDVINGVTLIKIFDKHVIYKFDGLEYKLYLEGSGSTEALDFSDFDIEENSFFSLMSMSVDDESKSLIFRLIDPNLTYEDFGLRFADKVTHINEEPVLDLLPISDAQKKEWLEGDVLLFTVSRDGEALDVEIDVN